MRFAALKLLKPWLEVCHLYIEQEDDGSFVLLPVEIPSKLVTKTLCKVATELSLLLPTALRRVEKVYDEVAQGL